MAHDVHATGEATLVIDTCHATSTNTCHATLVGQRKMFFFPGDATLVIETYHATSANTCHATLVGERKRVFFSSLEPISYFGHNTSKLTQNELKFQVKVCSDKTHRIDCQGQIPNMTLKP